MLASTAILKIAMMFAEESCKDLIRAINDDGSEFTWNGADYSCAVSELNLSEPNEPGGFNGHPIFNIVTTLLAIESDGRLVSRFPGDTRPQVRDAVVFRGSSYRIQELVTDNYDDDREEYLELHYTIVSADAA